MPETDNYTSRSPLLPPVLLLSTLLFWLPGWRIQRISSLLGHIPIQVLSTLMLLLLDTKSNVSLSILLERTSNNSLASGLGMDMNITPGRTRMILTRRLSRPIGTRASGLAKYRQVVPGVGTALVCEFLHLDFWFRNGIGFSVLEYWNFYISCCFGLVPKFVYLWR